MINVLSTLNGNYSDVNDFPTMVEATVHMEQERTSGKADSWEVREFTSLYKCEPKDNGITVYRVDQNM